MTSFFVLRGGGVYAIMMDHEGGGGVKIGNSQMTSFVNGPHTCWQA